MDKLQLIKSKIIIFIQNNYLAIIIASIIFLVFIPIIIFFNSPYSQLGAPTKTTPTPKSSPQIPPSPTTIPLENRDINQEQTAKDSGYIKYIVAEGDAESDTQKETLPDGSIKQTTSSENPTRPSIVILKNNSIIFMRYPVIGKAVSDGYKNLLGKQSHILPGPTFYGPNTMIYFYENGGTALTVDPKTQTTFEEFTFQPPISVEEFKQKYRDYAN